MTSERSNGYTFHAPTERWQSQVKRRTGLMNFTLRNLGVWTLRRGCCLSAASFTPFSSTLTDFSKIRAALTFCFFSVKGKEKDSSSQGKRKSIFKRKKIPITNKSVVTGILLFKRAVLLASVKARTSLQPLMTLNNTIAIEVGTEVAMTHYSATGVIPEKGEEQHAE